MGIWFSGEKPAGGRRFDLVGCVGVESKPRPLDPSKLRAREGGYRSSGWRRYDIYSWWGGGGYRGGFWNWASAGGAARGGGLGSGARGCRRDGIDGDSRFDFRKAGGDYYACCGCGG